MTARDLLAAATPRPWRDALTSGAIVSDKLGARKPLDVDTIDFYGGIIVGESIEKPDRLLILRAVNEYEALLDIADLMREWTEMPCLCDEAWTGRGLHAPGCVWNDLHEERDAVARLAATRTPELSPDNGKAAGTPAKSAPTASTEGA